MRAGVFPLCSSQAYRGILTEEMKGEIVVKAGPKNRTFEINYLDIVNGYNEKRCGE